MMRNQLDFDVAGFRWQGGFARNLFGTGMDDTTWAAHYAQLTPDAPGLMNAVVSGYPKGMPITYVSMSLDQPVPPELAAETTGE